MLLAIDPGTVESAYVLMDGYKPIRFGKVPNDDLLSKIYDTNADSLAVEMVESYGMSVGKEVFETVFWIGRFWEAAEHIETRSRIYRREEKITLCGTSKAKDANIRQALIDRFAYGVPNGGKGIKAAPGWFYGFHSDVWQAYAVGVTYLDKQLPEMGGAS